MCVFSTGSKQSVTPSKRSTQGTFRPTGCDPSAPTREEDTLKTSSQMGAKGPEDVTSSSGTKVPAETSLVQVKAGEPPPEDGFLLEPTGHPSTSPGSRSGAAHLKGDAAGADAGLGTGPDRELGHTGPGHSPAAQTSLDDHQGELHQTGPETKEEIQTTDLGHQQDFSSSGTDTREEDRVAPPSPAWLSPETTAVQGDVQKSGQDQDLKNLKAAEEGGQELSRTAEGVDVDTEVVDVCQSLNSVDNKTIKENLKNESERLCVLDINSCPADSFKEEDVLGSSGHLNTDEEKQKLVPHTQNQAPDPPSQGFLHRQRAAITAVGQEGQSHSQEDAKKKETGMTTEIEKTTQPLEETWSKPETQRTQQTAAASREPGFIDAAQEDSEEKTKNNQQQQPPSQQETERLRDTAVKELNNNETEELQKSRTISQDTVDQRGCSFGSPAQGAESRQGHSKAHTTKRLPVKISNETPDVQLCKQEITSTDTPAASNSENQMETVNNGEQPKGSSGSQREANTGRSVENNVGRSLANGPGTLQGNSDISFKAEKAREAGNIKTSKREMTSVKDTSRKSVEKLPGVKVPGPNSSDVEKSAGDKSKQSLKPESEKPDPINLSDEQKLANSAGSDCLTSTVKASPPSEGLEEKGKSKPAALTGERGHPEGEGVEDFIKSIKEGSIPFSQPLKKHGQKKSPSQLPAITENHVEKPFDPEKFHFGLRKEGSILRDPSPAMAIKLNAANRKALKTGQHPLGNAQGQADQDTDGETGRTEQPLKGEETGGRFGRMSILSNLLSSPLKPKEKAAPARHSPEDCCPPGTQGPGSPLQDGDVMKPKVQGLVVGQGLGKGPPPAAAKTTVSPSSLDMFINITLPLEPTFSPLFKVEFISF